MDMPNPNTVGELRENLHALKAKLVELEARSADALVRVGEIRAEIANKDDSEPLDPHLARMNAGAVSSARSLHEMITSEPPDILWPC